MPHTTKDYELKQEKLIDKIKLLFYYGYNQKEIAEKLGISQSHISLFINHKRNLSYKNLYHAQSVLDELLKTEKQKEAHSYATERIARKL